MSINKKILLIYTAIFHILLVSTDFFFQEDFGYYFLLVGIVMILGVSLVIFFIYVAISYTRRENVSTRMLIMNLSYLTLLILSIFIHVKMLDYIEVKNRMDRLESADPNEVIENYIDDINDDGLYWSPYKVTGYTLDKENNAIINLGFNYKNIKDYLNYDGPNSTVQQRSERLTMKLFNDLFYPLTSDIWDESLQFNSVILHVIDQNKQTVFEIYSTKEKIVFNGTEYKLNLAESQTCLSDDDNNLDSYVFKCEENEIYHENVTSIIFEREQYGYENIIELVPKQIFNIYESNGYVIVEYKTIDGMWSNFKIPLINDLN